MSLNSFSLFRGDKVINASTLTPSMLNELRLGINRNFYFSLSKENKEKLHSFLWNDLHDLWMNETSSLKVPIVTTVGHILVYLAPFFPQDFMNSLLLKIKEYKSHSILYFSSFCYLSQFFNPVMVAKFILHYNIFNLISIDDSNVLPKLTESITSFPNQILHSLVEYYLKMSEDKSDNPYILKSAKIIVSQEPRSFSDLIKPDISLTVCDFVFSDNMPKLRQSVSKTLSQRSLKVIQDSNPPKHLFSSACKVLNSLILTKQVPEDIVHGIFTAEMIQKSVSLEDLLILPIEPELVRSIYCNEDCLMSLNQNDTQSFTHSHLDLSTGTISLNEFDGDEFDSSINSQHEMGYNCRMPKDVDFLPSIPLPDQPEKHEHNEKDAHKDHTHKDDLGPSCFKEVQDDHPTFEHNIELDLTAVPPPQMPKLLTGESQITDESNQSITKLDLSSPISRSNSIKSEDNDATKRVPLKIPGSQSAVNGGICMLPSLPSVEFSPNQITSPAPNSRRTTRRKSQVLFKMTAKSIRDTTLNEFADYLSSQSSIDLVKIDPKLVIPLINYFKRFPEYSNELVNVMIHSIRFFIYAFESNNVSMDDNDLHDPTIQQQLSVSRNDIMHAVLKAISETQSQLSSESLNYLLSKIFHMADNRSNKNDEDQAKIDITLKMQILDMIGTLRADKLIKPVGIQMQQIIDQASISKEQILRKKAKAAVINLYEHTSTSLYKFFFDMYVQKLDVFDTVNFPQRLSFVSNVLHHIHGEWSISFVSLTKLFGEIISMFTNLHRNVILDILTIMTIFVSDMTSQIELLPFIKLAVRILETNYELFTGHESFLKNLKSQFIDPSINSINTNIPFETDIISNPSMWHRHPLKCARVAYRFLSRIPWRIFTLTPNDIIFINRIILHFLILLPKETDTFLILLDGSKILSETNFITCVKLLASISHKKNDVIAFTRMYCLLIEQHKEMNQIEMTNIIDSLKNLLCKYTHLTLNELIAIKNFLVIQNIPLNQKIFQRPFDSSYLSELQQKQKSDRELIYQKSNVDSLCQNYKNDDSTTDDEDQESINFDENDLSSLIFTLTPLIYVNLDIPPEFLKSEKIMHFCANSTASIDEDQLNQLFEFALNSPNPHRMIFYILRYSYKNHYVIEKLEDSLDHPVISLRKIFTSVFLCLTLNNKSGGFASLSPKIRNFIRKSIKTDLVSYVLNASPSERMNCTVLLKFDPNYFLERFEKVQSFTKSQLINICIYIQSFKFPFENIFKFIIKLYSKYSEIPKFRFLIKRILTVTVMNYGNHYTQGVKNLFNIISCELGDLRLPISESLLARFRASEFIEFCYSIQVMSKNLDCQQMAEYLCKIVKPSSPLFYVLKFLYNKEVDGDLFNKGINALLPSTRSIIALFISDYLKTNVDFKPNHEFISNIFKIYDNFANPALINPLFRNTNHRIITAMTFDSFLSSVNCLMNHHLSFLNNKLLFNSLMEQSNFSSNSSSCTKCISLMNRLSLFSNCSNDLLNDIYEKCIEVINSDIIYIPSFLQLFYNVSRGNKLGKFREAIIKQLQTRAHYNSSILAGNFALYLMLTVNDVSEANTILNFDVPHFYVLFNALVSIQKKNRSMVNVELQKRFSGVQLKALEMLNDPKFRIFAPLLALIEHDHEIPIVLKNYLDSIQDKIQRVYITDHFHEF